MKVITPLLSVLILGSMSVLGMSEHPSNELAQIAVCMVKCGDFRAVGKCFRSCSSVSRKIPVLDVEAGASDRLACMAFSRAFYNWPVLSSRSDSEIFIEEIRHQTRDWKDTRATLLGMKSLRSSQRQISARPGRNELRFTRVFAEGISRSEIKGFTVPEPDSKPTRNLDLWLQCVSFEDGPPQSFTVEIGFRPVVENPYCEYWLRCEHDEGVYSAAEIISLERMPQGIVTFRKLPLAENFTVTVESRQYHESFPSVQNFPYNTFKFSIPRTRRFFEANKICVPNEIEDLKAVITHKKTHIYDVHVTWRKAHYIPDLFIIVSITSNCSKEFDGSLVTPHNVSGRATETIFRDVNISQHFNVSMRGWSLLGGGPVTSKSFTVPDGSGINIITATLAFATLSVVTGVCIYLIRRRRKRRQRRRDKDEIDPDRLTMTRVLGSGAFGVVKFGKLREDNGQVIDVAVKMLRDDTNQTELRNFRLEIEMTKSLGEHPNIVSLVGYRTTGLYPFLVVEYCPRGDLLSFLRVASLETKTDQDTIQEENATESSATTSEDAYIDTVDANQDANTVTVLNMLNFSRQIATGMEFLSSKRIIHRDLAARNVLVCDRGIVKISDFGMSRDIYQENMYRKTGNGRMPFKWMAIESLIHQVFTTESDVWSFGILLWEIFTLGHTPYLDIPTLEILKRLQSGYRMERPEICSEALYNVMLSCWEAKPKNRPTFTVLRKQMDRLIRAAAEHEYLDADYISFGMTREGDSEPSSPRDTSIPLEMSSVDDVELSIVDDDPA